MIEINDLLIGGMGEEEKERSGRLLRGTGSVAEEQAHCLLRRCRFREWGKVRSLLGDILSSRCPLNRVNVPSQQLDT